jgi:septum formation inhibitor MinC
MGDTAIPVDVLGAPLRLAYNADGSVKFSKTGRPVTKVAKEVADSVRLVRDNFTAGLVAYAGSVIADKPEDYKAQVEQAREAGEPIIAKDRANLDKAIANAMVEAVAEAEVKAKVKGRAKVAVTA